MKKILKGAIAIASLALAFAPLSNTYADGPEDEGRDDEYCQSLDLDQVETYTVHFETYGGTPVEDAVSPTSCSLREMNKVPNDPQKDDHTFFGWYRNEQFNTYERWTTFGEIPQSSEITLYALFVPNSNVINTAALYIASPVAGSEVTVEVVTEQGAVIEFQNPIPEVSTDDHDYEIMYAGWNVTGSEYEKFEGTFVAGENYDANVSLFANEDFRFSPNFTATVNGNNATTNQHGSDGSFVDVYATITAIEGVPYVVEDESGNSVAFNQEEGHDYNLNINQYSFQMTDEELEQAQIDRETYETGKAAVTSAVEENGEVIAFIEFELTDENQREVHNGPFDVKIKFTDDMKGYDRYMLVYVEIDDINGVTNVENAIELTLVDGYLVGTVPHFSGYALLGANDTPDAPDTGAMTSSNSCTTNLLPAILTAITTMAFSFFVLKKYVKH